VELASIPQAAMLSVTLRFGKAGVSSEYGIALLPDRWTQEAKRNCLSRAGYAPCLAGK
jgi:hypothetical protein